jgi:hypothetical protein
VGSLLGDNTVAKEPHARGSGDRDIGDPPRREAHHPFDEAGVQTGLSSGSRLCGLGCGPSEDRLPTVDGRSVLSPFDGSGGTCQTG